MKLAVLQEVTVKAVRASKNAPFAVANINKKTLRNFAKTGQELPLLFARTPGILAWSENGVGTGSTYMVRNRVLYQRQQTTSNNHRHKNATCLSRVFAQPFGGKIENAAPHHRSAKAVVSS